MTPRELDWICNGVPVNIYKRPDGSLHASVCDFSRFNLMPEAVVRVPARADLTAGEVEGHVTVLAKMEELSNAV